MDRNTRLTPSSLASRKASAEVTGSSGKAMMISGASARAVSMSLRWRAASKPASVVATTSMPRRSNSSVAPAVTALTKSAEVCQSRAAVAPRSRSMAASASETMIVSDGVAASPPGPIVSACA